MLLRLRHVTRSGRGRTAPPARRRLERRLGGAGAVLAAVGVAVWLQGSARGTPAAPGRVPPFTPGPLRAELGDGTPTDLVLGPGAVLYVDDACLFCAEEMRRWDAATSGRPPQGLTVIRHPGADVPHPGVVPPAWASRTLVDRSGAVAMALGVTAVPFLALTDSDGTVVQVTMGLTTPERILTLLETMASPSPKGVRP